MPNSDEKVNKKSEYFIQFKTVLQSFKSDFKTYPISDIPSALKIHNLQYKSGYQNIYLQSVISNPEKEMFYWLGFDIESSENHKNIQKNIDLAGDLLSMLDSKDLLPNIQVALTGYGFRFFYPFFIPTCYNQLFLEFLNDFSKLGIDTQIHKSKFFFRITGYRGHELQCRKNSYPIDRHIHYLESPDKIPFSESDYLDLVSGKPDYHQDMAVFPKILPVTPIPEKWIALLEPYQSELNKKNSFWHGFGNAKYGKLSREQLESVLGDNCRIVDMNFGIVAKLKKCPVCNQDGSYVTEYGRLKCKHNRCQASERDTEGRIGLSARDWCNELADLIPENEDVESSESETIIETKSIQDIRTGIEDAIKSESDYLINVMPGVGKTTTTLQSIAPFCKDYSVLYLTPNHKLNSEISDKANELGIKNIVLTGRNEKNCKNFHEIQEIAQKGYSIKLTLCIGCKCYSGGEIANDPVTGENYQIEKCDYQKQFELLREPGLYIAAYQFVSFSKVAETFANQGFERLIVIFDENPVNAYTRKTVIKPDSIRSFKHGCADADVENFFDKIQKFSENVLNKHIQDKGNFYTHARFYATDAPAGSIGHDQVPLFKQAGITDQEITALDRHLDNYRQAEKESIVKWQWRLLKDNVNFNALKWLQDAIANSGCAYLKIDYRSKKPIQFVSWQKNTPQLGGCRIICLDATGNKSDLDSLFSRDFQVLDGNVEMPNLKKTWIKLNTGKMKITHFKDDKLDKLEKILKDSTAYLRDTDKKILLITFKGIKDNALPILKRLLPDRIVDCTHFGAGRGLNQWQDFDAVICLGWLNLNKKDALDLAMMLYPEKKDQDAFIDRSGKNEVLQAVHRIRPLFSNKNIILISKNWLPELGAPDTIKDNRKTTKLFEEAVERCDLWINRFKCIDRHAIWSLGICTESDEKIAEKGYQSFKKIRIDNNLGMFKNETLLKFGGDYSVYGKILNKIAEKHGLPACELKLNGKWLKALGKKEDFQNLYQTYGKWHEDFFRECKNM